MGLESGVTFPLQLNSAWPLDTDTRREGAAHIRETKKALVAVTANLSGVASNSALLHMHLRIGAIVAVVPGDNFSPANYVGGTWVKAGSIAVNQSSPIARDSAATDLSTITPPNVLCLWQRTA